MVSLSLTTTFAILTSLVAAQNPIVASLASQIVDGIAAAKTDDNVSNEQATSELMAVMDVVTKNPDMIGLFSKALPIALQGLNEQNFPDLLSAAGQSLDAFEGSPDYAKVSNALHSALPHYDVPKAMANVENNLARVMAIATPNLPSLTPKIPEQWSRATMRVQGLVQDLGLSGNAPSFAKEEDEPTTTEDAQPEATGDSMEEDSTKEGDDSPMEGEDSTTGGKDSTSEDSTTEDSTTEGDDSTTEDSTVEDGSTVDDGSDLTTDKQLVGGSEDSTVEDDSSSSNTTVPTSVPSVPNGNGIDQANAGSAFNVQLAAGAAVVAAFAALI